MEQPTTWERKETGVEIREPGQHGYEEPPSGEQIGYRRRERESCPPDFGTWMENFDLGLKYDEEEFSDGLFYRAVFAEGAATTAFVYFVLTTWMSLQDGMSDASIIRIALSAGLAYGVLNWAFFSVSGGHMNPAVTLGMMLGGRITFLRAIFYWGAQIVGGIVGAAIARGMSPGAFRSIQGGANMRNIGWGSAFLGEILGTLLLVTIFLFAFDRRRSLNNIHVAALAPWEIALAVIVAHLVLVPYTLCSINPARSFGPAVIAKYWSDHWLWWVGPLIGGAVAPILYESFFKWMHTADIGPKEREAGRSGEGVRGRDPTYGTTGHHQ